MTPTAPATEAAPLVVKCESLLQEPRPTLYAVIGWKKTNSGTRYWSITMLYPSREQAMEAAGYASMVERPHLVEIPGEVQP